MKVWSEVYQTRILHTTRYEPISYGKCERRGITYSFYSRTYYERDSDLVRDKNKKVLLISKFLKTRVRLHSRFTVIIYQ